MTAPREAPWADGDAEEEFVVREGLRVGATLEAANLVLVLGDDPRLTAVAALGVARAQADHRRVALGDLLGDAEPIQRLLNTDDPHGLADSFVYGVSLNKIAQHAPQYGDLYVLPSGCEVPAYEEIFTNARWKRLLSGFRETGALLVVAAPVTAEHVGDVIELSDGAIVVGDADLSGNAANKLIDRVQLPPVPNGTATPVTPPPAKTSAAEAVPADTVAFADAPKPWWKRLPMSPAGAALGLVLAIGLASLGVWLAARPLAHGHEPAWLQRRRTASAAGTVPSTLDSLRPDSTSVLRANVLVPANPSDSLGAAAYGVVIARFNTQAGAIFWLQKEGPELPGATFAPILVQGATWYRAIAGSYASQAQADSLLAALRQKGQLRGDLGEVIRAPFAFLVDSVKEEAVPGMLKYFADRGQPVYALRQTDGSARLYAGAFESPEQASLLVDAIRTSGIRPVLVYRIGRVY